MAGGAAAPARPALATLKRLADEAPGGTPPPSGGKAARRGSPPAQNIGEAATAVVRAVMASVEGVVGPLVDDLTKWL